MCLHDLSGPYQQYESCYSGGTGRGEASVIARRGSSGLAKSSGQSWCCFLYFNVTEQLQKLNDRL